MASSSNVVRRRAPTPLPTVAPDGAEGDLGEDFAPLVEGQAPHRGLWSTLPPLAWALLGLLAALAVATVVVVSLDYAGDKDSQILSAVGALQASVDACCAAVQAALTALAESIDSLSIVATETLANTEELLERECLELTVPAYIDAPGCYELIEDLTCDVVGDVCVYVVDAEDVTIRGNGFSIYVDPTAIAFGVYFSEHVRISGVAVWTSAPSNDSNSRAVDVLLSDDLVLEDLVVTNLFRPISASFVDQLSLLRSTIQGANAPNYAGFGNRVVSLDAATNVRIAGCSFLDNNVHGFDVDGHTTGVLVRGASGSTRSVVVEDCDFIDTRFAVATSNAVHDVSIVVLRRSRFTIGDPQFSESFVQIGNPVRNSAPIRAAVVEDCIFECTHAFPGLDGVKLFNVVDGRFSRNAITMNANSFLPEYGFTATAVVHVGILASAVAVGLNLNPACSNIVVEDNVVGGSNGLAASDAANARALLPIYVEPECSNVVIARNVVTGIAAGHPGQNGTGQCAAGAYAAQHPAGIYIDAGVRRFTVVDNVVRDGSCAIGNFTIPADGIVVAGAYNLSSFCPSGHGPVSFPDADGGYVAGNTVSGVCGAGIKNFGGPGTRVWNNQAWDNGFFNFLTGPNAVPTIVLQQGDPAQMGANLEALIL